MPHNPHPTYRPDIDGLRAIAVLSVVMFHAFPDAFPGGYVGVDVFFVISGFLITGIITDRLGAGTWSFTEFYLARCRRIFPALAIVLVSALVAGWFLLSPQDYNALGEHAAASAAFVQNIMLWTESGYFDSDAIHKPLLHLWSLSIEEQYYLVFPLVLLALWRWGQLRSVFIGVSLLACASFAANIWVTAKDPSSAFYLPHTRAWELMIGALLAITRSSARRSIAAVASVIGVALLAVAMAISGNSLDFPGWLALLPAVGAALVIYAGKDAWINRSLLSNRLLVWIGLISYPLYLWHWPMLSMRAIIDAPDSAILTIAIISASICLAWVTYAIIERPIRLAPVFSWKPVGSVMAVGLTGIAALGISLADGVPGRVPPSLQAIATYAVDFRDDARAGSCWIGLKLPPNGYAKECAAPLMLGPENVVAIWGDSYSGRLYPGLRKVLPSSIRIAQFSRDGCPPILGMEGRYPHCPENNDYVLSAIKANPPSTVILFSRWVLFGGTWRPDSELGGRLLSTIAAIHEAGVQQIFVIGPAPEWRENLPKLVYKLGLKNFRNFDIPTHMKSGLNVHLNSVDQQMHTLIAGSEAQFVSAYHSLCNDSSGCLVKVSDSPIVLSTWDYGHLTTPAAMILARNIPIE